MKIRWMQRAILAGALALVVAGCSAVAEPEPAYGPAGYYGPGNYGPGYYAGPPPVDFGFYYSGRDHFR